MLALASDRLARALSVDSVFESARARCDGWASAHPDARVPRWISSLVGCPLCTGWWISLGVSAVAPGRHRLLRGIAVAGAQVMLSLAERLVSEEGRVAIEHADLLEEAPPEAVLTAAQ